VPGSTFFCQRPGAVEQDTEFRSMQSSCKNEFFCAENFDGHHSPTQNLLEGTTFGFDRSTGITCEELYPHFQLLSAVSICRILLLQDRAHWNDYGTL
jgi:hypothetical protein